MFKKIQILFKHPKYKFYSSLSLSLSLFISSNKSSLEDSFSSVTFFFVIIPTITSAEQIDNIIDSISFEYRFSPKILDIVSKIITIAPLSPNQNEVVLILFFNFLLLSLSKNYLLRIQFIFDIFNIFFYLFYNL